MASPSNNPKPSRAARSPLWAISVLVVLALSSPLLAQQPGQITDRVVTAKDPGQSYALYLPSKYTPKKRWPVIFAFDPGANGRTPVALFQEAAEKYGYIVAGSNNSANGPRRPQVAAILAMLGDVQERFSLDPQRLYAAGFSGGARVAGMVGFFCNDCIRAVIACGGGFPEGLTAEQRTHLPAYFFTVGRYDFNYFDVLDSARSLPVARVVLFDGPHQWAPPELAMQAVEWLEAGAKDKDVPPATPAEAAERKRLLDLARPVLSAIARTQQTPGVLPPGRMLEPSEDRPTGEPSFGDARGAMAALRKKREQAKPEEVAALRRALGLAYTNAWETAQRVERENKPEMAARLYEVAAEAAPTNPGVIYETASAWAAAGNKKKALAALRHAVELGFHDADALAADKHFDALRSAPELQAIVSTMH